ncbi:hypothetical protein D3C72_1791810 [compost metagenome]
MPPPVRAVARQPQPPSPRGECCALTVPTVPWSPLRCTPALTLVCASHDQLRPTKMPRSLRLSRFWFMPTETEVVRPIERNQFTLA